MPPPKRYKKRRPSRPPDQRFVGPSSAQSGPKEPEVRPDIASIIQRTRAATTRAEFQQLCQEAVDMEPEKEATLRAFYQKKIDSLPPGT